MNQDNVVKRATRPVRRGEFEPVRRKVFKIGGSVAVRIPKELADALEMADGTPVMFRREGRALVVERLRE